MLKGVINGEKYYECDWCGSKTEKSAGDNVREGFFPSGVALNRIHCNLGTLDPLTERKFFAQFETFCSVKCMLSWIGEAIIKRQKELDEKRS